MPFDTAMDLMFRGPNAGHDYGDVTYSACAGNVCDTSFKSLARGTSNPADSDSTAMNWWAESWGTHQVAWSSAMQGSLITIDFGSMVNLSSLTVWGGMVDVSVPYQAPVRGTRSAIPADPNWSRRTHILSGINLIGTSVGVKFSQVPGTWDLASKVPLEGSSNSTGLEPVNGLLVPGVLIAVGLLGRKRVD
jgi:hypothetical protein